MASRKIRNGSVLDGATVEMIRVEYIKGDLSIQQLANKYDVPFQPLKQRAVVGKWSTDRDTWKTDQRIGQETRRIVESRLIKSRDSLCKLSTDTLLARTREFQDRLLTDAESSLDSLAAIPMPNDYEGHLIREQVMANLQRRGRIAFGLDDGARMNVTLQVQSELPAQRQLEDRNEVLEVETVPNVDTSKTPAEQ